MTWKEGFYEALVGYLRQRGLDAVEVLSFEDDTVASGYCETCYYESVVAIIRYKDSKGVVQTYQAYEAFADIVSSL